MQKSAFEVFVAMSSCSAPGCKLTVPAALEAEKLCILHFTMEIERHCAEMRRETAVGRTAREDGASFWRVPQPVVCIFQTS
jgi:hypothetical protein